MPYEDNGMWHQLYLLKESGFGHIEASSTIKEDLQRDNN